MNDQPSDQIVDAEYSDLPEQESDQPQTETQPKPLGVPEEPHGKLRQASALIPVVPGGAAPANYSQMIDLAQYMARANSAIPAHLRNNVGACLAVMDIAARAGNLSPYMVANKTYVQNDRLCFESQLFHALIDASGLLKEPLTAEYTGEGKAMKCKIIGHLKGAAKPHEHESEPLGTLHPGYTEKNGKKFVKGSPLWDRKPKVQLFYDTVRDWVRLHAPMATLGIYAPEEMVEYADQIEPSDNGLRTRIANTERGREGHKADKVTRELANVAADTARSAPLPAKREEPADNSPDPKEVKRIAAGRRSRRRARAAAEPSQEEAATVQPAIATTSPEPEQKAATLTDPKKLPDAKEVARVTKEAEKRSAAKQPDPGPQPRPVVPTNPQTVAEYIAYAEDWIGKATDEEAARKHWDKEKDLRDALVVTVPHRLKLIALLSAKFPGFD